MGITNFRTSQYFGKAMKVGIWFATNKSEKCSLAKNLEGTVKILAPHQLSAEFFELAHILVWHRWACNQPKRNHAS